MRLDETWQGMFAAKKMVTLPREWQAWIPSLMIELGGFRQQQVSWTMNMAWWRCGDSRGLTLHVGTAVELREPQTFCRWPVIPQLEIKKLQGSARHGAFILSKSTQELNCCILDKITRMTTQYQLPRIRQSNGSFPCMLVWGLRPFLLAFMPSLAALRHRGKSKRIEAWWSMSCPSKIWTLPWRTRTALVRPQKW